MTSAEDAPVPVSTALEDALRLGVDPEGDIRERQPWRRGHKPIVRKPARYYVVFEMREGDKEPNPADLEAMRELGLLMLKLRVRVSSCGCNGGTWFATRRGRIYDRFAVVDSPPTDPRLRHLLLPTLGRNK